MGPSVIRVWPFILCKYLKAETTKRCPLKFLNLDIDCGRDKTALDQVREKRKFLVPGLLSS
jgi:hypothetical protein